METNSLKCAQKLVFDRACENRLQLPSDAQAKHYHVLFLLIRYCNHHSPANCYPSRLTIARITRYGISKVKDILSDLKEWGVVTIQHRFNSSNVYTIHWEGMDGSEHVAEALMKFEPRIVVPSCNSDVMAEIEPEIGVGHNDKTVDVRDHKIAVAWPSTKSLEVKDMKSTKCENQTIQGLSAVLQIWNAWNKATVSIGHRETQVPAHLLNSVITNAPGAIVISINHWISENPDWESRWQLVLEEIPVNKWFRGFARSNGQLWHPTLRDMFVPKGGYWTRDGHVPMNDKEIGVDRVLSGEFDSLRMRQSVSTTHLSGMVNQVSDQDGYECI